MKKSIIKIFTLVLLFSFIATPVIAQVMSAGTQISDPPDFTTPSRPEPELLPQEILDEFEGGMTIEEFLTRNQGPIPNALLDYANIPLVVVVQLDKPSLIEFVNQGGVDRSSERGQIDYISQLVSDQTAVLGQIMTGRGGEVTQIGGGFTKTLNGFMLRVPANAINEIRAIPGVKSVTRAPEHELNLGASVPLIGADDVWHDFGFTGEGITIAVIDTGIDYTHAMLGGSGDPVDYATNDPTVIEPGTFPTAKVIGGYDFAGSDYNAGDPANNIPMPDPDPLDEHSHGTHVAATAAGLDIGFGAGVAPDAKLYALKVFGRGGSTNLVLHAIEWAMDPNGLGHLAEPVDVINMSLGSNWGPADETDPQYQAVENATSIGVVVVASAGNAGNSSYIVGSPSTSDSAISVAASTHNQVIANTIDVTSPSPPPSEFLGMAAVSGTGPEITADIIGEVIWAGSIAPANILGCVAFPKDSFDNAIALIQRGGCNFSLKVTNAYNAGAKAVIVYNNEFGTPFIMGALESTLIESVMIDKTDGDALASYVDTSMDTVEVTINKAISVITNEAWADLIASFSSRGPRGFDSKLKPEITAPGVAIIAADFGTGNLGTSKSGTSMAAPHIAGVAALLAQAHPGWDPVHIKAAMMNTAVDLVGGPIVPRHGAGRVDAYKAATTSIVAYADPKLVSLPWGLIEVFDTFTDTQTLTIRNFGDAPVSLEIETIFITSSAGATLTPAVTTVNVPAYGTASVDVTLVLDASMLPLVFGAVHEEYYGFVQFSDLGGVRAPNGPIEAETLRVPFYFVPRPYTEITELGAVTRFDVNHYGLAWLQQTGPKPSSLWAYPVSLVSPHNPNVLDAADLRYVGMDYGWFEPGYGDIFVPAFAMWGGAHTNQPFFNEVNLYIDTPYGSVVNFNYNFGWLQGAQNNQWVVVQVDFADGWVYLASPWFIYADYNSGFQEWYLPAVWHYVLDEFEYEVVSFDWNGNFDYGGAASFDITKTPLVWMSTELNPYQEDFYFLFAVPDWYAYDASGIQGIMLVDYFGKPGAGQSYYWSLDPYFDYFYPIFGR